MNKFLIKATDKTPGILIDYFKKAIKIKGKIVPEDTIEFWKPILIEVEKFFKSNLKNKTTVSLMLTYYNTANTKSLFSFFSKIKEALENGNIVKVRWFYHEEDEQIYEEGKYFNEITGIPFSFCIIGEQNNEQEVDVSTNKKTLIIRKAKDTPSIILNPDKKIFEFKGDSWCLDAVDYYRRVISWFNYYFDNHALELTEIEFKFGYINTSSAKQIAVIIDMLKEKMNKHKIIIRWFYEEGDCDMLEEGQRYADLLQMDFEFIEAEANE